MRTNTKPSQPWIVALGLMLFMVPIAFLHAQLSSARVTGTVTDSSRAEVPGARITLVNENTGVKTSGQCDASGIYLIPFLNPGSYSFSVDAPNFKRYIRNLTLVSGQVLELNVELEVGSTSQTITVTGATPLLQTTTSDINQLTEQAFVKNMPLESGRSGGLVRLMPGVAFVSEETFEPQLNFALAGGQGRSGEYRLDGGNVTLNALLTRTIEFNPPIEATQEMSVEVNAYPAEYGHSTGGVFSITSKSGTNQFHGSVYEDLRNNDFDARSYFSPSVAPRKYNVFGAEVDGPIRKDKAFFMVSYEGTRRVDGFTRVYQYPSQQEVHGDFSDQSATVIDPLTHTPFSGNIIPASRMDPVGAALAALYPAPNVPGAGPATNNYIKNTSADTSEDSYFGKVDYNLTARDRFSFRFIEYPSVATYFSAIPVSTLDPNALVESFNLINTSPAWVHTFSSTLFNDVRYTYSHRNGYFPSFKSSTIPSQVGLTGVPSDGTPQINVTGLTSLGSSNYWRFLRPQITHTVDEELTWLKGKHTMKFGGEYRYSFNRDHWGTAYSGAFTFNPVATGNALASLELGWTDAATTNNGDSRTRSDYLGVFAQDDWKVNSALTLNIGVRYDLDTPRWERSNRQTGFDPTTINPVSGTPGVITYAGVNGVSKYISNWDINNVGPRFGFVWQAPHNFLVFRGGWGLIFGPEYDSSLGRAFNAGQGDNRNLSSPDNGVTPAFLLKNGMPTPNLGSGPGFGAVKVGQIPVYSPSFIDKNHQNLYANQFNASVERQLTGTTLLEVEYIGNMAHKIGSSGTVNINETVPSLRGATQNQALRPFPQYGNVSWWSPDWGNSSYNSLNVEVEKRFSEGLNFLTTYTWSKFLDDIEAASELAPAANFGEESYYAHQLDKGLSGNDFRQRVTISFVYDLPVGENTILPTHNSILNAVIGGWSLGTVAELRSGLPWGVYEQTNKLNSFSAGQRSNIIGNPNLPTNRPRAQLVKEWFNTSAFAFPGNGVLGNTSKSVGTGPGYADWDTSLLKDFKVEKQSVQFRSSFFNIFNRPNFGVPNGSRGSATFGRISTTVNNGRFIQLSLRYMF